MTLTHYGIKEWGTITLIAAAIAGGFVWAAIWWPVVVTALVWLALVAFFRDPRGRRPATDAPNDMVSPADGKISAVFDVEHHTAIGGPAKVIRIFLSVLDVHINRAAQEGTVVNIRHQPGRYLDARMAAGARVNENLLLTLQLNDGRNYGIRQISGAIARRIVCPVKVGDRLLRGQRYGMIQFGSTTELILAQSDQATSLVSEGTRVYAGRTSLARLNSINSTK